MKKLLLMLLGLLTLITFSSCNNNISLSVHAKESDYKKVDLNEILDEYETEYFDESEVYEIINADLSISYDTFICEYNDVIGIGFSDYNYMYENDYGYEYVACGFIPFEGENPTNQIVDRIDNCNINYINTYTINNYKSHFIMDDTYVSYEIIDNNVKIDYNENDDFYYKSGYGSLYNYDTEEYIYNYEICDFEDIKLTSLSKIEDTDEIIRLINESFEKQDLNFYNIKYKELIPNVRNEVLSYLENVEEEFLGIDVDEIKDFINSLNDDELMEITEDGLTKALTNKVECDKTNNNPWWLKTVTGVLTAVVTLAAVAVTVVTAGVAAPIIATSAIGVVMEVFNEVVIEDRKELNLGRVLIAGVAGIVSGIPGVGFLADSAIDGIAEFTMSKLDGKSTEEALRDGFTAFGMGVAIGETFKLMGKFASKIHKNIDTTKKLTNSFDNVAGSTDNAIIPATAKAKVIDQSDKANLIVNSKTQKVIDNGTTNDYIREYSGEKHPLYRKFLKEHKSANDSLIKYGVIDSNSNCHWHHIVEQNQIKNEFITAEMIYSEKNTIALEKEIHKKISSLYSTKICNLEVNFSKKIYNYFTDKLPKKTDENLVVRVFMKQFDFDEQYEIGIEVLRMLGVKI